MFFVLSHFSFGTRICNVRDLVLGGLFNTAFAEPFKLKMQVRETKDPAV